MSAEIDPKIVSMLECSIECQTDVLEYISGFIVKSLLKKIKCPDCAEALFIPSTAIDHVYQRRTTLLHFEMFGQLVTPSTSVTSVVNSANSCLRRSLLQWTSFQTKEKESVVNRALLNTRCSTFASLQQHALEHHVLDDNLRDDHITALIKIITRHFINIFCHRFSSVYSQRIVMAEKPSKRNRLTKLVLFSNQ